MLLLVVIVHLGRTFPQEFMRFVLQHYLAFSYLRTSIQILAVHSEIGLILGILRQCIVNHFLFIALKVEIRLFIEHCLMLWWVLKSVLMLRLLHFQVFLFLSFGSVDFLTIQVFHNCLICNFLTEGLVEDIRILHFLLVELESLINCIHTIHVTIRS